MKKKRIYFQVDRCHPLYAFPLTSHVYYITAARVSKCLKRGKNVFKALILQPGVSPYRQSEVCGSCWWCSVHCVVCAAPHHYCWLRRWCCWNDLFKKSAPLRGLPTGSLITGQAIMHLSCIYLLSGRDPALFQTRCTRNRISVFLKPLACVSRFSVVGTFMIAAFLCYIWIITGMCSSWILYMRPLALYGHSNTEKQAPERLQLSCLLVQLATLSTISPPSVHHHSLK